MKSKSPVLTKEERDVIILAATHPGGNYLSNSEIGQRLGVSVNRVKTLIHQACIKMGARTRNEAIILALRQGDVILTDFWSLDELAEFLSSLYPDTLRRIANIVRQGSEYGYLLRDGERNIPIYRRQDGKLTKSERDVIILAGNYGLTNKEIADRLYISISSVKTFLNRAYTKLGACKRADAFILALKQREISIGDLASFNDLLQYLAPLGPESIDKLAQLLEQKLGSRPAVNTTSRFLLYSA